VFFSSDYVFDGLAGPYDESAATAPASIYGRHKVETEQRVLDAGAVVIRTTAVRLRATPWQELRPSTYQPSRRRRDCHDPAPTISATLCRGCAARHPGGLESGAPHPIL
jgi:hypothetical protein